MTKKIIFLGLAALLFLLALPSLANSPFSSQKKETTKKVPSYPSFVQKTVNAVAPMQRKIRKNLSDLAGELKKEKSPKAFILIFFFSFLYGVLHALGPGHGKVVAFSYFASSDHTRLKSGVIAGTLIAFMQALSAIILVSVMYLILNKTNLISIEATRSVITRFSFGMIFLLGIYLLVDFFRSSGENPEPNKISRNKMWAAVFSVGIIPCAGTIIILLFTLSLNIFILGIAMTFFIAAGMALTISLAGMAAISSRQGVFKFLYNKPKLIKFAQGFVKLSGALLIILFGSVMLIGSL